MQNIETLMNTSTLKVIEKNSQSEDRYHRNSKGEMIFIDCTCSQCKQVFANCIKIPIICLECRKNNKRQQEQKNLITSFSTNKNKLKDIIFAAHQLERYKNCTFDNFNFHSNQQNANFEKVIINKLLAFKFDANILLTGKVGCGKNYMIACLINHLINDLKIYDTVDESFANKFIFYELYQNVMYNCREDSYNTKSSTFDKYTRPKLLIIDDVLIDDNNFKAFSHIIVQRYHNKLATVLISNQSKQELMFNLKDNPVIVRKFNETLIDIDYPYHYSR